MIFRNQDRFVLSPPILCSSLALPFSAPSSSSTCFFRSDELRHDNASSSYWLQSVLNKRAKKHRRPRLIDRNGRQKRLSIFPLEFWFLFVRNRHLKQSRENTPMSSAAMLCSAFCICDVMNKSGMCGNSIKYVTSQSFSAFCW